MLKMTISKLRKICSVSLIPHILRDEFTLPPSKLGKRGINGFWKMNKSTDSKDKKAECEKCKRLIDMVFGPEKPESVLKKVEANLESIHMKNLQKAIPPGIAVEERLNETDGVTASDLQTKEKEPTDTQISIKDPVEQIGLETLKSTTASENKEELAQKLEVIEEPALVEAPTPKTEGFNTPPRVLGDRESIYDTNNSLCAKIGPEENALDEIAKKCLGSPPDKIDERIIEEMKTCGVLGRGRRKATRRPGSFVNRTNKKDTILETKSDESTFYCEKPAEIDSCNHSTVQCDNKEFTHHSENINEQYFKNVPFDMIEDRQEQKTEEKDSVINNDEGKAKIDSTHSLAMVDSYQQIPVLTHPTCNTQGEVSEEVVRETSEYLETEAYEKENPKPFEGSIEKELDVEEIHVTATETSRLEIPGQAEVDADVDDGPIKPDIFTCNQISLVTDMPMIEKSFTADKRESYVTFSNYHANDQFGRDLPDRPFNNPSTAISGTYAPEVNRQQDKEYKDTAISSKQNPGEYFDLSHIKMEKLDAYAINPLTIRPLEAYHPYTIISGTDGNKPYNIFLTGKETLVPEVPLQINVNNSNPKQDLSLQEEKQDAPETPNKNISSTIGPLPELKDEELSLTEMLKKVRERNRVQFYQETECKSVEVQPVEANKCTDPVSDGSQKTLGPGPCKPKPKPACPPKKCPPCPPPCPPPCKQKDPCAKFTKPSLIGYKVKEAFSFVLHVGLKPLCVPTQAFNCNIKAIEPLRLVPMVEEANRVERLGVFLLSKYCKSKLHACNSDIAEPYIVDDTSKLERLGNFLLSKNLKRKLKPSENEDVILAKDYEPWVPIPSWPIPQKEKKEPFVCPKEGCKLIPPPRLNPPCKENPCINMPKRSYSIDSDYEPIYV